MVKDYIFGWFASVFDLSFYLLDDDFEDDASLGELEADVLARRCDLAQLGHCVEPLLWCDDNAPLAAVLLLQKLDKHVRRIVAEAFCPYRRYNVVLAKVFEVLRSVLRSLDPKRIVLRRLTLIGNLTVQQKQALLHRDQICH